MFIKYYPFGFWIEMADIFCLIWFHFRLLCGSVRVPCNILHSIRIHHETGDFHGNALSVMVARMWKEREKTTGLALRIAIHQWDNQISCKLEKMVAVSESEEWTHDCCNAIALGVCVDLHLVLSFVHFHSAVLFNSNIVSILFAFGFIMDFMLSIDFYSHFTAKLCTKFSPFFWMSLVFTSTSKFEISRT